MEKLSSMKPIPIAKNVGDAPLGQKGPIQGPIQGHQLLHLVTGSLQSLSGWDSLLLIPFLP